MRPLVGRDDARHEVHRPGPFEALLLAIDRKGDAQAAEDRFEDLGPAGEVLGPELVQAVEQGLVRRAGPVGIEGLRESVDVVVEQRRHRRRG